MALKPHRVESYSDVSNFMDTAAERGGIVVHVTSGSGVAMDDGNASVAYPTGTPSGTKPAGLLLTTVSTNSTKVGRFLGSKDADGYVKVDINIT